MEFLRIKNFLIIEEADFEIGRFNIIIGSQASGKSIIAKLLYFFREFFSDVFLQSIQNINSKQDFKKEALNKFNEYFPSYTWNKQSFEIFYTINDSTINLINNEAGLQLNISKNLLMLHENLQKECHTRLLTYGRAAFSYEDFQDILEENIFNTQLKSSFQPSVFICAGRIFFPNIQKNIFSFLTGNIEIEPFLKKFGSTYEMLKRIYNTSLYPNTELKDKLNAIIELIIKGKYANFSDEDWIEYNGEKINLYHASSGQQESLPMLIILLVSSLLSIRNNRQPKLFIEEPEAHLFPVSQKHLISFFGLIYNQSKNDFIITTHSPYILTAINNAILAHDVIKEKGKEVVRNIFDPDFAIQYEDVRAYTIENGKLTSILDDETRLIGASVIDSVSDEFENVFNQLLEL